MAQAEKFQRDKTERPEDLIFGIVASILLHSILFIGASYWLQAFTPKQQSKSQPIPIEFVEVPPADKKPPPQTKRRAANDSVAGGEAKPKLPISAATTPSAKPQASASIPRKSPEPTKSTLPNSAQSTAVLPRYAQPQPKPQKTVADPIIPKLQLREKLRQSLRPIPAPKPQPQATTVPTTPSPEPTRKTAVAFATPKPQPKPLIPSQLKPQKTTIVPVTPKPQPKPEQTAAAPSIPKPQPLTRQEKNPLPSKTTATRLSRATRQTPSQAKRSQASGAASKLGGPVTLSSRNLGGSDRSTGANSNRSNRGAGGIDARRDVDLSPYLAQLQQRVRQQWIPGLTQRSQRTVIYFVVSRSGMVRNLQIIGPSGSSVTDQAALGAIQRAAPFAPLPTGYSKNQINIRYTFNINVYGQLDLQSR
jgi:TonB family protein